MSQPSLQSTITLVRAIGTVFMWRFIKPLIVIGGLGAMVLLAVFGWLSSRNLWWLVLEVAFVILTLLFLLLVLVVRVLLRGLEPRQTVDQKRAVESFVDKMERVSEHLQTPQLVIVFRVLRDMFRPRQDSFIKRVAEDSKTLAPDFKRLQALFDTDDRRH